VGRRPAARGDLPGRPPDPERFVAEFSGSDRTVAEYLLAEMLDRQPADVQDLLLRTSLLERVNGELADLLTGRPGSERILLDLEDANAFVESLDPERAWFRYHHLLADFLRLELRQTLPGQVPVLHRRAAEWFTRQGQVAEAIRHTQAAGDWAEAARLLADHSFSLTLDGQAQTMQALVRAFPPGADHPELALVRALGDLARGRLEEAAAHLAVAEAHVRTTPPDRQRRLQVAIASLKLALARRRGHLVGVIEQVRFLASPVTGPSDEDIALGNDLRAVALMNLGTAEAWSLGCRTRNATCGRAPSWPGRSAGPTWKLAAWRSSLSRMSSMVRTCQRSMRSPRPSGAAARRSHSPNGTAGARNR
jgi:LuxR family transcriptional regulator, maltose regulon positive regulatory protein